MNPTRLTRKEMTELEDCIRFSRLKALNFETRFGEDNFNALYKPNGHSFFVKKNGNRSFGIVIYPIDVEKTFYKECDWEDVKVNMKEWIFYLTKANERPNGILHHE